MPEPHNRRLDEAITEALGRVPAEFTAADIADAIGRFGGQGRPASGAAVAARLRQFERDGVVSLVRSGQGGQPNVYTRGGGQ